MGMMSVRLFSCANDSTSASKISWGISAKGLVILGRMIQSSIVEPREESAHLASMFLLRLTEATVERRRASRLGPFSKYSARFSDMAKQVGVRCVSPKPGMDSP